MFLFESQSSRQRSTQPISQHLEFSRLPVVCARSSFARPELVSSRAAPRRRPQQRRRPFKPVAAPAEVNALARAAPEKSLVQYPEITHEFRHGTTSLPRFDAGTRNPVSKGSQRFRQGKYGHDRCEHCICAKPSRDWPQAAIPSGSASGRPRKRGPPAAAANASRSHSEEAGSGLEVNLTKTQAVLSLVL